MIRVEIGEAAGSDLDGIYDYGAARFGEAAADAYLRRFDEVFDLIRDFPLSGAIHQDVRPPIRSLPSGSHRVYYDVESDRAVVRRVLHKTMDVERHL